jgi:hypothetical protein
VVDNITPYEQRVREEIAAWQEEKAGAFRRAMNVVGRPVEQAYEHVPEEYQQALGAAVVGALEAMKDTSRWTYSDRRVVKKARKLGLEVESCRELGGCELEDLDRLARSFFTSNKMLAALEGGGFGLGGPALVLADIPALFFLSFRTIQQIGVCYGFDMEDPEMLPVVMNIFNAGTAASGGAAKAKALADIRSAATALGAGWTYKKIAESTHTGVLIQVLQERARHLPKDIAGNVTRRKLVQALPLVGAAFGAGFNYWFMSNTARGAYMIFRDLHLARKYGVLPKLPDETAIAVEGPTGRE